MSCDVLDTDTLTLLLTAHASVVAHATESLDLAITIVTVEEILTGWYTQLRRARSEDQLVRAYAELQRAVEFLSTIRILPFNQPAVVAYHQLRATYRRAGRNDLKIAAIVLHHDARLVTRNNSDFVMIPGLSLADWSH
jgi:tRNA(fMet)-specific endonuclease VapC